MWFYGENITEEEKQTAQKLVKSNSAPIQTWAATEILSQINFTDNNHPIIKGILCYIRLMEYLEESGVFDIIDLKALKSKLKEQVVRCITRNTDQWETSYICKPSQFLSSKDSIFYSDNMEIAECECNYIFWIGIGDNFNYEYCYGKKKSNQNSNLVSTLLLIICRVISWGCSFK